MIKTILAARGVHYVVTRFGPQKLRAMAFDAKYDRGKWRFHSESAEELHRTVRRYLRNGDLLMLGCGGASVLEGLDTSNVNSVLGIDLSQEAILLASQYASTAVSFQVADMETFEAPRSYDEILFSESLYYVRGRRQLPLLQRLSLKLKPSGSFVVTLADAGRYRELLDRIRANFRVIEDRSFMRSKRHLVVFQPK